MAGAEKAWDRLKKSEEKTKKQHDAAMKARVSNTASAIGSGNRANSTKSKVMKSSDIQRQPAAKKVNSYDEDMKVLNSARRNSQRVNDLKEEGRRHYDEVKKSQSRTDTIRQNARAKAGGYENAARRERYERESAAFRYASSELANANRRKLEQAFKEEKNGGKKVQLRNTNLMKKYGR